MKKLLLLSFLLISNLTAFGQYDIKTVNRPDGVTMKYFNPMPVAITNSHEAGLSLYKNANNNTYLLAVTVLFKANTPSELNGNLIIQTSGNKGISLKPVMHKLINMNGRNVASSMYLLTNQDIVELRSKTIKLISFYVNEQAIGLNLTENKNILIKEFSSISDNEETFNSTQNSSPTANTSPTNNKEYAPEQLFASSKPRKASHLDKVTKHYSNNQYYNTDLGSSKYDSEINWGADINTNDVQGSLNRFREQKWEQEWGIYRNIGIGMMFLGIIILIYKITKEDNNEELIVNSPPVFKKIDSPNIQKQAPSEEILVSDSAIDLKEKDFDEDDFDEDDFDEDTFGEEDIKPEKVFEEVVINKKINIFWASKIEDIMIQEIKTFIPNNPWKGDPIEGLTIINKMQIICDEYETQLTSNKIEFDINDVDIEYIISKAYNNVYPKFIES